MPPPDIAGLVDAELGPTSWIDVGQERIDAFAAATLDPQWIHVDPDRAAAGPFGTTVAHGFLVLALVVPMLGEALPAGDAVVVNYGLDRVRFTAPVPAGSRVRGRFRVSDVAARPSGLRVAVTATIEREGGDGPVCVADLIVLIVTYAPFLVGMSETGLVPWPAGGGRPEGRVMKIIRMLAGAALVAAVAAAIIAPAASSFAFVEGWVPVDGTVGVPYSWQFKSYGGCSDHRFSIHSGSLPAGLTLQSNGTISGTPTAAGTSSFWVWIDDKCGSQPAQRPFTLTIIPKLTVTTPSPLAPAQVGAAYGVKLTADGGGSQTWSLAGGALPPGFALAPDGTLSGTAAAALDAPASFVAMVTDGSRTDTKTIQLDVVAPLAVTPPAVAASEVGHALKPASATAAGGSRQGYAWSLVGNPAWLTIDPASGALSGTPTAAGTYPLQVAVKDAYGATATANIAVTVRGLVRVSTTRFAATRVGRQFRATLHTAGGVGPFRWKASGGKFPVGIRLTPTTGVLAGKPRQAGRFTVTFTVTDALGQTSEKSLTLDVKAKPKPKTKKK